MKNLTKTLVILFLASISFIACEKEDDTEPTTPVINNNGGGNNGGGTSNLDTSITNRNEYVYCKIDGVEFTSRDDTRFNRIREPFGNFQLIGTGPSGTGGITITLWDYDGRTGVFDASTSNGNSNPNLASTISLQRLAENPRVTYDCSYNNSTMGLTMGSANITRSDSLFMEGTFEFTAVNPSDSTDKVVVTEGAFKLERE